MFKFPSIAAAVLTGLLWMPLFIWSVKFIERNFESQLFLFWWTLVGFALPAILSTSDLRYIKDRLQAEASLFGRLRATRTRHEDYKVFLVPTWSRMAVLFLSTIVSVLFLRSVGIDL
jgi:hypothetical protein